ncbi:MAG: hypothetical protein FJ320_07545, partial [SAR202 cluster bacterium]|nr:hypothetical protein [SAR202 cluster bacterium]
MRIRVLTSRVSAGERGQMAIAILLAIPLVFMFFALALDAGMWFFDHRRAQNQADAAALAAVQELPYASTAVARDAALDWLEKNGAARESVCDSDNSSDDWTFFDGGVAFQNRGGGTGYFDTVRVCVRRDSLILFSALSGVAGIKVSAAGAAGIITQSTYYAIFANRACVNIIPSLDFPGSNATVIGGMHSNCNLKVGGSNNTFAGLMTYAHALEVSGSNNHCNGSPCISDADSTPVIPMPINYTYDDVPCTYTGV